MEQINMSMKILTRSQLESVIYTWFKENENCIIELQDENLGGHIYFMSYKLPDDLILLSLCVGSSSVGDIINPNDNKSKMVWINN